MWVKGRVDIKKNLIASLSIRNLFLKTKLESYGDKIKDFYDKEIHQVDSNHICLPGISLDSALSKDGNYYPKVF